MDSGILNKLPVELILEILKYLGPEDLVFNTRILGDRWEAESMNKTIWEKLTYRCGPSSCLDRISEVLSVAPALHSLNIDNQADVPHIFRFLCDRRVDIRKLVLKDCFTKINATFILTEALKVYPDLEVMSLEHFFSRSYDYDAYSPILHLKKLTELNLSRCQGLNEEMVYRIVDSCQHLKKLRFDETPISDNAVHIIANLGEQLTTLVVYGLYLTDVAYSYLKNCPRLQELGLLNCTKMTDTALLEGIGPLKELTSLRLTCGRKLTAQALSTLLNRPSMTFIVSLDLSGCENLDDEGLRGIAERCADLKELDVSLCRNVTDVGISNVVNNCSRLRLLNLNGLDHITGDGWFPLVPAQLRQLRLLCLDECFGVCDEHVTKLMDDVPKLAVIKCSGNISGAVSNELRRTINGLPTVQAYPLIREWVLGV